MAGEMSVKRRELRFITPHSLQEFDALRSIFQDYANELQIDLCFQGFAAELAELPGDYAPPRGTVLMALVDEVLAACCALRPLDTVDYPNACEMKRLFVRKAYRSTGIGRQLVDAILEFARLSAYDCVLLDTLDDMESARTLYQDLGFEEIAPYYHNPIVGAHYLMAKLNAAP
jgi:ribosomal protein S18 acetylase RimI-like enzyme